MDPAFQLASTIHPRPEDQPRILGLRLHPLTLGHLFLFVQYDVLTFSPEREIDLSELLLAIFICSNSHQKSDELIRKRWFPFFLKTWAAFIIAAKLDWLAHLVRFKAWLIEQQSSPSMRVPDGFKVRSSPGAPTCWNRLTFLTTKCSMPIDKALSVPILVVNALQATWMDSEHRAEFQFITPNSALWQFAKREDAKRFNHDGTRKEMN